jgi:hypothetical protein
MSQAGAKPDTNSTRKVLKSSPWARHSSRGFFLVISNHALSFRTIFSATTLIAGLRFLAGFPAVRALLNVIVVEVKLRV